MIPKCACQDNCFLRELGRIPQNGKNWSPVGDLHNFARELSTEHASPKIAIFGTFLWELEKVLQSSTSYH